MSLRKALFLISFIHIIVAIILSAIVFLVISRLNSLIPSQGITLVLDSNSNYIIIKNLTDADTNFIIVSKITLSEILSVIQIVLPVLICIFALLSTVTIFYQIKLKKPLEILAKGASRIIDNDLDFTIKTTSLDELGQLCIAFETMRCTLLDNNRKLWQQTEERKRLNAAFAHNLRNPVTVLKGSVKLIKKGISNSTISIEQFSDNISLIENYTTRIEAYIETMSNVQRLEEIPLVRIIATCESIFAELENMINLISLGGNINIQFKTSSSIHSVLIDKSILFQIAENLVSNALRFSKQYVYISCSVNEVMLEFSVTDDGVGFPNVLIEKGVRPFQKGNEDAEHFGMGLYISKLLANKHDGDITIHNNIIGSTVSAALKIS